MSFFTDYLQINAADDYQDWTYSDWSPTDNNVNANTPIYIEAGSCIWWPWSKGTTGGYAYCTASGSVANRLAVGWFNMAYADIVNIPVTQARFRLCSTSWTSNYSEWDMLAQIASPKNTPISGHTPIMIYPTNPDATNGTFNPASLSHTGYIGTTGETADGKQGGFDMIFLIGYVGYHSETRINTFFSGMYAEAYDSNGGGLPGTANRPLGILSESGDSYVTNVNFRLGHGTSDTADTIVSETGKVVNFNNVEPEHNLGYIFVAPSGVHEIEFTLINCVHFWNQQTGTNPKIYTDPSNCAKFQIQGGSYARGGTVPLPDHISTTLTYVKGVTYNDCGEVLMTDVTFEDNIISDATLGTLITGTLGTHRMKNNSYSGCSDALKFDTAQTIDIDGDQFSGNTYDVWFTGTGTLTINALNGSNISTSRVTGGGTVVINNSKTFKFTLNPSITGYEWRIYSVTNLGSLAGSVELDGEEIATADNQTYTYNYVSAINIAVQIITHPGNDYEEVIKYYILGNASQDVGIDLKEDINN